MTFDSSTPEPRGTMSNRVPYPPPPAVLARMPGYVPNLHRRAQDGRVCLYCDDDWPCDGAALQLRDAGRFTNPFWLNSRYFDELARSLAAQDSADAKRKERKKTGKTTSTEAALATPAEPIEEEMGA